MGIAFTFFVAVIGLVWGLGYGQVDDPLSEQAERWLQQSAVREPDEAFLLLFGIAAPEGESPARWGRARLAEYHASLEPLPGLHAPDARHVSTAPPADHAVTELPLPEGDPFCPRREPDCLARVFALSSEDAQHLVDQHHTLHARVREFLRHDRYQTGAVNDIREPFEYLFYLFRGLRLELLKAVALYRGSQKAEAIRYLRDVIARMRVHLALQDTLTGKVVMATAIADAVDLLALMAVQPGDARLTLDRLSDQERDLARWAAREFSGYYRLCRQLDRNPGFLDEDHPLPGGYVRLLFKPNMSANAMVPELRRLVELSRMPPAQFAAAISAPAQPVEKPPITSWIRNYAGNVLVQTGPGVEGRAKYAGMLLDLDLKIYLFNHRHTDPETLSNPYYPERHARQTDQSVCLDGPLEDPAAFRCLPARSAHAGQQN